MSRTIRIRAVARWVTFVGALGLLTLAGALTLQPGLVGIPWNHVIVSGDSMLPTFEDGDLVLTRGHDAYERGAVVAYRVPTEAWRDPLVIHRIVAGDARRGYIFQGDNRTIRDPWLVKPEHVLGEASLRIPKVGLLFTFLREPAGFAALAAIVSLFFVMRRENAGDAYSTDESDAYAARKSATSPSAPRERHQLQPWTARTPTRSRDAAQPAKPSSSSSKTRPSVPPSEPPRLKRSVPNTASRTGQSARSESASGATAKPRTWRALRKLPSLPRPRAPR
jgi:signal peptidase I